MKRYYTVNNKCILVRATVSKWIYVTNCLRYVLDIFFLFPILPILWKLFYNFFIFFVFLFCFCFKEFFVCKGLSASFNAFLSLI